MSDHIATANVPALPLAFRSSRRLETGRAAIVFRPEHGLDLGSALLLTSPLARLSADRFPRTVLMMDYGYRGPRIGLSGLTEAALDRLACLPEVDFHVAVATRVPAIARLAATIATTVPPETGEASSARNWFQDVLLAAGLLATRATHAVVEAAGVSELLLTRRLVARLDKFLPGTCPFPTPLLSGYYPFLSLDGDGIMGGSPKGTIYVSDSADVVLKKIRSAKTDGGTFLDPGGALSPEVCNLLLLLHALTGESSSALVDRLAGKGYSILKNELAAAANAFLDPIRERRSRLLAREADMAVSVGRANEDLERTGCEVADALVRGPVIARVA